MITRQRQSGMSIPGILAILIMLGFFVMCGLRMAPPYFEYLSVKEIISNIAGEHDAKKMSVRQIRRKIANIFNSNQIYELHPKEVEIFRTDGKTYVDANYEVRLPVMGRIDMVLKFDDVFFVMGNPEPLVGAAIPKKPKF
ncbi:MAG: DUF4845 domain-containing protein [Halioglobus sp.]